MRSTFKFQTLILWTIAPLMLLLSVAWSWHVYGSVSKVILDGFDRKLLSLSGSLAALIDPEAHVAYQESKKVTALCDGPEGMLYAYDAKGSALLSIDRKDGGARLLQAWPYGAPSSLVYNPATKDLYALAGTGDTQQLIRLRESGGAFQASVIKPPLRLDGLFFANGKLQGWSGRKCHVLDSATGAVAQGGFSLPEAVRSLTPYGSTGQFLGLAQDGLALLQIDREGKLLDRLATRHEEKDSKEPVPELLALVSTDGRIFAAGPSLVEVDGELGTLLSKGYSIGYFSEKDPFYLRYRKPMTEILNASQLTYLYTYVYQGGDLISYVLDGTEGPNHSMPGTEDRLPSAKAIEGAQLLQHLKRPWMGEIQAWEQWGLLKDSGYPIVNAAGETIAVAGADVDITIIRAKTRWALFAVFFIGVVFFVITCFVSVWIARSLIRPLRSLKEFALHIAAGYYGAPAGAKAGKDTAFLANTLSLLAVRLEQQQQRSQGYQTSLHGKRRQLSLAIALDEYSSKYSISDNPAALLSKSASGNCWRGLDGALWLAPALEDEVAAACLRARLVCLGRQLLASSAEAEELPSDMLACSPSVNACARWKSASNRLYYATRRPSWLRYGDKLMELNGQGSVELGGNGNPEWVDAEPEIKR